MYLVRWPRYFYIHFLVFGFTVILKLQVSMNYPTLSRITQRPTLPYPQPPHPPHFLSGCRAQQTYFSHLQAFCSYCLWQLGPRDQRPRLSSTSITCRMHQEMETHIVYKNKTYFTTFLNLKLNNSKTTHQILKLPYSFGKYR